MASAAGDAIDKRLIAATGRIALAGSDYPATAVWCYSDQVPGPEIRLPG
jgi:hypothetical protein